MKNILSIIAALLAAAPSAAGQDWTSIVDRIGPSVAKIEVLDGAETWTSGSGFVYDASGLVLTNAHVVESARYAASRTIRVTFPRSGESERRYAASIVRFSPELDLAVLSVPGPVPAPLGFGSDELPRLMSEALVAGFPLGKSFKSTPGFIQALQDVPGMGTMIDLSAAVDPGNSGGPVLNDSGAVIGIVTSKIVGYNFNLALPIRNVVDFLSLGESAGSVSVSTTPPGSRIFVNGNYRGLSPLTLEILNRSMEIRAELDGHEPATRVWSVGQGGALELTLLPAASLKCAVTIATDPPGAQVRVDNSSVGVSPIVIEVDKGTKIRLRIQRSGYRTLNAEALVGNDPKQVLEFRLEKSGWF